MIAKRFLLALPLFLLLFRPVPSQAYTLLMLPGSMFSFEKEPKTGLANSTELGLSITSGNTSTRNFNLGSMVSYRWPESTLQLQANYFESGTQNTLKARKWMIGTRYEQRIFRHFGAFAGQSLDADLFSGYVQRYGTDLGCRLTLWHNEKTRGAVEVGYRHQLENRLNGQLTSEISRLFFEGGYFWNPNASTILATEFLPVLNRMRDWHWNSELNLTTKLSDLFRLKTAYGFRYAHIPVNATLQQWDQLFTTSLVAEF